MVDRDTTDPDPRRELNPVTGKPIGDSRISPFSREEDIEEREDREDTELPDIPRPRDGHLVLADTSDPDWKQKVKEALFGPHR